MDENSIEIKTACIRYQPRLKQIVRIRQSTDEGITLEASPLKLFTVANLRYQLVVNTKLPCLNLIWDWQFFSVSGSNLSRYKINSVAWVFHPFIIYFPSSVAHSHWLIRLFTSFACGCFFSRRTKFHQRSGSFDFSCRIVNFYHNIQWLIYWALCLARVAFFRPVLSSSFRRIGNMSWLNHWFHESRHLRLLSAISP